MVLAETVDIHQSPVVAPSLDAVDHGVLWMFRESLVAK
jgi:hypothetical protein